MADNLWSLANTTVRNPERLPGALSVFNKKFHNEKSFEKESKGQQPKFEKELGLHRPNGELIKKGDILATGINFENYFMDKSIRFEVLAKENCIVLTHYPSSSVMQGSEIYQVMEKYY